MSRGYNHVWRNYWERYQRKKLLGIISSFKKVTGYKTKIQKLILLLHTTINIKCLRINLTKYVQDLYIKNDIGEKN